MFLYDRTILTALFLKWSMEKYEYFYQGCFYLPRLWKQLCDNCFQQVSKHHSLPASKVEKILILPGGPNLR